MCVCVITQNVMSVREVWGPAANGPLGESTSAVAMIESGHRGLSPC